MNTNATNQKTVSHRFKLALILIGAIFVVVSFSYAIRTFLSNCATTSEESIITYDGKSYEYNSTLSTYLFLGIDKMSTVEESEDYISGGQADALFLIVADSERADISIISIHRNTMMEIEVFNSEGASLGYRTEQICLQHGYGDGMETSCELTVTAISKFFYDIPIDGYVSLNMGGISILNDAVGGVTLAVLQSFTHEGSTFTEGETVTLTGQQAYSYLRMRDTSEYDSASNRLLRLEQYARCFCSELKNTVGTNYLTLLDIYDSVKDYVVTDLNVSDIVGNIADYNMDDIQIYSIPGETVMGDEYEEFYVDDEDLYEMILEVFYVEVS